MTSRGRNITLAATGILLILAVCLFTFGRRTQVVENIKKHTAALVKKEYIPDQHVNMEETMAFQQADSLYDTFRKHFRMHYQTIGTATFPDSSRIILIAEPAPFLEPDSIEKICTKFTHETVQKHFKIGYDGRITDLLIHLAYDQVQKPATKVIEGEQLNILIGSWPFKDDKVSQRVKLNIMNILHEKYGITEADFQSAELCACPAYRPRDFGLDRSLIGAYGQDDKVCCFAQFKAETETQKPEFTSMMVFADKEETGSDGPTGMRSVFWRDFLEDVASAWNYPIRHVLRNSLCLSCDVNAGVDPSWPEVFESRNSSYIGKGPVVSKYTGSRGKYSTNDATAETMGYLRRILDDAKIPWQVGELGKIDAGGGGTIASEISIHNLDTIDMGVPVLSMHAPLEITSKVDDYLLYKAMKAFFACKTPKDF